MIELSFIIPNYQTEPRLLFLCLKSINNNYKNEIEIIIVDDGSSEHYRKNVYNNTVFQDRRIVVIYKDNGGVSSARNIGIREARGDYVTFVDADDVVSGNFVEESLLIGKQFNADIVIGGMKSIEKMSDLEQIRQSEKISRDMIAVFDFNSMNDVRCLLLGCCHSFLNNNAYIGRGPVAKIIKSKIAKKVLFNTSLSIYEDVVWNMDVIGHSNIVCKIDRVWYGYHNTFQSASKGFHKDEIIRSTKGMLELVNHIDLSNQEIYKSYVEQCIIEYSRIVNNYFLNSKNKDSICSKLYESKKMLLSYPWSIVNSLKSLRCLSKKMKVYGLLYVFNIWIPVKAILLAIRV